MLFLQRHFINTCHFQGSTFVRYPAKDTRKQKWKLNTSLNLFFLIFRDKLHRASQLFSYYSIYCLSPIYIYYFYCSQMVSEKCRMAPLKGLMLKVKRFYPDRMVIHSLNYHWKLGTTDTSLPKPDDSIPGPFRVAVVEMFNWPFPNYLKPLSQNESWCPSFEMKIIFHSHAN